MVYSEGKENFEPINYRLEIKTILKAMNKSNKQFNFIFQCTNEKTFRNYLNKPTKILFISCHGFLELNKNDEKHYDYHIMLEENGVVQKIQKEKLEEIIKNNSSKIEDIDLVFISSCHSEILGKIFIENKAKNVIYTCFNSYI